MDLFVISFRYGGLLSNVFYKHIRLNFELYN